MKKISVLSAKNYNISMRMIYLHYKSGDFLMIGYKRSFMSL